MLSGGSRVWFHKRNSLVYRLFDWFIGLLTGLLVDWLVYGVKYC